MKKFSLILAFLAVIIICLMIFVKCGEYNREMYDYLKNPDNYNTYTVKLVDVRKSSDDRFYEVEVIFKSEEDALKFSEKGTKTVPDYAEKGFVLKLPAKGADDLYASGFIWYSEEAMSEFYLGEEVQIRACNYEYKDRYYYYMIGLNYEGKDYLDAEKGLGYLIEIMDDSRSLY